MLEKLLLSACAVLLWEILILGILGFLYATFWLLEKWITKRNLEKYYRDKEREPLYYKIELNTD